MRLCALLSPTSEASKAQRVKTVCRLTRHLIKASSARLWAGIGACRSIGLSRFESRGFGAAEADPAAGLRAPMRRRPYGGQPMHGGSHNQDLTPLCATSRHLTHISESKKLSLRCPPGTMRLGAAHPCHALTDSPFPNGSRGTLFSVLSVQASSRGGG